MPLRHLQTYYASDHAYVELEPEIRTGRVWIMGVWVDREYRGNGEARALLSQVVAHADKDEVDLYLTIMACDDDTLESKLFELYKSYGFELWMGGYTMKRAARKEGLSFSRTVTSRAPYAQESEPAQSAG